MKWLSRHQVLRLHTMLTNETGGCVGLRDEGLLDSALNAPFQSFDGEDLYHKLSCAWHRGLSKFNSENQFTMTLFCNLGTDISTSFNLTFGPRLLNSHIHSICCFFRHCRQ